MGQFTDICGLHQLCLRWRPFKVTQLANLTGDDVETNPKRLYFSGKLTVLIMCHQIGVEIKIKAPPPLPFQNEVKHFHLHKTIKNVIICLVMVWYPQYFNIFEHPVYTPYNVAKILACSKVIFCNVLWHGIKAKLALF